MSRLTYDLIFQFKEINGDGNYSKEKILTALYQNEGNVEATIDQLNSYVIKGFNEHMWTEPEPEGPRTEGPQSPLEGAVGGVPAAMAGDGAVRGHGMEENDGAMDSVINKADFQEMIKNKGVDKEVSQFEAIWASTQQNLSSGFRTK